MGASGRTSLQWPVVMGANAKAPPADGPSDSDVIRLQLLIWLRFPITPRQGEAVRYVNTVFESLFFPRKWGASTLKTCRSRGALI